MKKFYWIEKDYQNRSLNNLAQNLAEYYTADLLLQDYDVYFSKEIPVDGSEYHEIGKLGIHQRAFEIGFNYHINDLKVINGILNYNLYFQKNTEERLSIPENEKGTFDCLVSLAAGDMIYTNPDDVGLKSKNHYVIDISPIAIHKSMNLYKESVSNFFQLDLFDIESVKTFLDGCEGTKGFFLVSNCFMYIISSLVYDVRLRLEMQNKFIEALSNHKIDWYVSIYTADGTHYSFIRAKELKDKTLDQRFNIFPWIKK
jgi:hypothetical protein